MEARKKIREMVNQKIKDMSDLGKYGLRSLGHYGIHSLEDAENRPDVKITESEDTIKIWIKLGRGLLGVFEFYSSGDELWENVYITGKYELKDMIAFLED